MAMMMVDAGGPSSYKKRKRSNSKGKGPAYSGPKLQDGSFYSRNARAYGMRSVVEPGYVDLAYANYDLNTTGSLVLLNTIGQGAGTSQRVGKRVALKSLQCRGNIQANDAATSTDVAYMIVYDKRPTGVLPAITDILVTASPRAFNNDTNSGRFRILKRVDEVLIGSAANQYTCCSTKSADWYLDLKGLPQVFKAAGTGAIGDIEEGALYLVTVGAAAGTSAGTLGAGFRVRYIDV